MTDLSLSERLLRELPTWARELGFADAACASLELDQDLLHLRDWLSAGYHGEMQYMARDPEMRATPAQLQPNTLSVISVRMDYLMQPLAQAQAQLARGDHAYVARYALGRDYHKLIRKQLVKLAERMQALIGAFGYRVLTDSAPSLEKALARNAKLGWIGKNTLLLNKQAGSLFFLGEIYTDLPLPPPDPAPPQNHCGSCSACLDICPTNAFVGPHQLDARRCIAYLTIEHRGAIPEELRPLMGNRIFGCDDCQLVCPWNRYAQLSPVADFAPRHQLDSAELLTLWAWDETDFLRNTEGMALRRTGWRGWLRNLAVALGNAPADPAIVTALNSRLGLQDEMIGEHISWALQQQQRKLRDGNASGV